MEGVGRLRALEAPVKLKSGSRDFEIEILFREGFEIRARIDGRELAGTLRELGDASAILEIEGRRFRVMGARRKQSILVAVGPRTFDFAPVDGGARRARRRLAAAEIIAPMPGKVLKVLVNEGDVVSAGQAMVIIEAMKMETTLSAESPAVVKRVCAKPGDTVDHGAVLIELSPAVVSSALQSDPEAR